MRRSTLRIWVSGRIGLGFVTVCLLGFLSNHQDRQIQGAEDQQQTYKVWPSQPPTDCPFPKSTEITGIGFTGRHSHYAKADTWYPSWAANGNLYSPWTDGTVNDVKSVSFGAKPTTGFATIIGDDPLNLKITDVGVYPGDPAPYEGRYPCGSLVYNGVWYYGYLLSIGF
jgi:hypothetical protein